MQVANTRAISPIETDTHAQLKAVADFHAVFKAAGTNNAAFWHSISTACEIRAATNGVRIAIVGFPNGVVVTWADERSRNPSA